MFNNKGIEISEMVEARKQKIADEAAWELLRDATEVIVGRGRKFFRFIPSASSKTEILSHCLGRTGNLRAPAIRVDGRYIVGFTEEMYAACLDMQPLV